MSFYVAEPSAGDRQTFDVGAYPRDRVLESVRSLDLASGKFHVSHGLFDSQTFCRLWDGPLPVLGAYTKDLYATYETEKRGEIVEHELEEGQGVIESAYVAFFPNSVVAVLRTTPKSPGSAKIANWLSLFTEHPVFFTALPRADVLSRLERPADDFFRYAVEVRRSRIGRIQKTNPRVATVLQELARMNPGGKIGFWNGAETKKERLAIARAFFDLLQELGDALPEFHKVSVSTTSEGEINVTDPFVTRRVEVPVDRDRRIKVQGAAQALSEAYSLELPAILPALEAWHQSHLSRSHQRVA